jgi:very-short-patch-repair endonuclease
VADFYCEELRLVIELDGSQHNEEIDAALTRALEFQGLFVLRFWNNEVLREKHAVLAAILNIAQARTLTPTPLTRKGTPSRSPLGDGL